MILSLIKMFSPTTMNDPRAELWAFALARYPEFKSTLLDWQQLGAGVNDLILLGLALHRKQGLNPNRWKLVDNGRPRHLLRRLRCYRQALASDDPARPKALEWELVLEQWDLALLADCLDQQHTNLTPNQALALFCQHWQIAKNPELHRLIQRLGSDVDG